jgi:hypothetical protein
MGRFMSADPLAGDVGDPQSLNLYTYVRNNAVNLIDPSGLCAEGFEIERCGGFKFKFVITWSWGADHEDDGNPPLHPYPTRPPMRTSPAPHVAYGILPGETAGVPNWLDVRNFGFSGIFLPTDLYCEWGPCNWSGPPGQGFRNLPTMRRQGRELGEFTRVFIESLTPLKNIAVDAGLFVTGAGVIVITTAGAASVCLSTGGLACPAAAVGAAAGLAGGAALIYTGVKHVREETLPSLGVGRARRQHARGAVPRTR